MSGTLLQKRVKELAKQHGSIRAVARVLQVDHAYLWRLANGKKEWPEDALLRKLRLRRVVTYMSTDMCKEIDQAPDAALAERGQDHQSSLDSSSAVSSGAGGPSTEGARRASSDDPIAQKIDADIHAIDASLERMRQAPAPPESGIDIIGGIWRAIGRHQVQICRPDAELAPPQYLIDAVERARDALREKDAEIARLEHDLKDAHGVGQALEAQLAAQAPVIEAARASSEDADDGDLSPFVQRRLMRLREAFRDFDKKEKA